MSVSARHMHPQMCEHSHAHGTQNRLLTETMHFVYYGYFQTRTDEWNSSLWPAKLKVIHS